MKIKHRLGQRVISKNTGIEYTLDRVTVYRGGSVDYGVVDNEDKLQWMNQENFIKSKDDKPLGFKIDA